MTADVRPDGTVTAPVGPALAHPARAFGPSAVALAGGRQLVVGSLKSRPDAFSRVAPVAAATLAPGRPQPSFAFVTLQSARVSEPIAVPLSGHRALVSWAGQKGWGALLASAGGLLSSTAVPPGSPPVPYHFNPTNRDLRSAGRRVVLAWERGDRVRVTTRAF